MTLAVKVYLIILGVSLIFANLVTMGKRKMRPSFGVVWSVLALLPIVAGILLHMDVLEQYVSWTAVIAAFLGVTALVIIFYISSLQISDLQNKTQELFMQVVLLNEENRRLRISNEKREDEEAQEREKKQ